MHRLSVERLSRRSWLRALGLLLMFALAVPNIWASVALGGSRTYTRSCADSVYGELGDDWRDSSIVVGRLAFVGAKHFRDAPRRWFRPDGEGRYKTQKIMVQIQNGDDMIVRIPRRYRDKAALVYDPSLFGRRLRIRQADYQVTFDVCANIAESPHRADVTQYNGGFVVAGKRCVPVDVLTDTGERLRRVRISFGARC